MGIWKVDATDARPSRDRRASKFEFRKFSSKILAYPMNTHATIDKKTYQNVLSQHLYLPKESGQPPKWTWVDLRDGQAPQWV
jgi:hypothetical protein